MKLRNIFVPLALIGSLGLLSACDGASIELSEVRGGNDIEQSEAGITLLAEYNMKGMGFTEYVMDDNPDVLYISAYDISYIDTVEAIPNYNPSAASDAPEIVREYRIRTRPMIDFIPQSDTTKICTVTGSVFVEGRSMSCAPR